MLKRSGTSTLGYGKTKEVVLAAYAQGMTIRETASRYGLSYTAVYNCFKRNGLDLRYEVGRARYGSVKALVLDEHAKGMTAPQIWKKHGLSRNSVRAIFNYCNLRG